MQIVVLVFLLTCDATNERLLMPSESSAFIPRIIHHPPTHYDNIAGGQTDYLRQTVAHIHRLPPDKV